jgi:hypothetical protein
MVPGVDDVTERLKGPAWRRWLPVTVEAIAVALLLAGSVKVYDERVNLHLYEPDEAAWVFSSYYYHLYFEDRDWLHADWREYDALDHPPLAKYAVGLAMDVAGEPCSTLEHKRFWHRIPIDGFAGKYRQMMARIPAGALPAARHAAVVCALLGLGMLYLFTRSRFGPWVAVAAIGLSIWNPVVQEVSTQALSDPVLLAISIGFLWVLARWVEGAGSRWFVGAAALVALAVLTKLSGGALGFMLLAGVGLRWKRGRSLPTWKRGRSLPTWEAWAAAAGVGLSLLLLLNPTFHQMGPAALLKMVDHRLAQVAHQHLVFPDAALTGIGDRLAAGLDILFFKFSPVVALCGIPLELMLFLAGLAVAVKTRSWYLLVAFAFLVVVPVFTAPLAWERYYFGAWPVVYLLCGLTLRLPDVLQQAPTQKK